MGLVFVSEEGLIADAWMDGVEMTRLSRSRVERVGHAIDCVVEGSCSWGST
jgi:hypothetical protein